MAGISSFNPFICKTLSVDRPCRRLGFKNPFSPSNPIIISSKNSTVGLKFSASTDGFKFSATDRNWAQPAKATDDEWGPEPKEELGSVATTALVEEGLSEVDKLKRGLIDSLNGTNRGLKASSETRAEILEFITQLEAKNPTPAPTEALPLLNGKWILAYTSFSDLFPLLGRSLPLLKVGEISQTIDSECFTVQNSVQFEGPLATTSLSTNAKFDVRSPKRVQIKFEEGIIGTPQLTDSIVVPENVEFLGQKIDLSPFKGIISSVQDTASSVVKSLSSQPPLKIPITNTNAQSWLLTTYLDEELRISRGDGGSVFVLIKEGSSLLIP